MKDSLLLAKIEGVDSPFDLDSENNSSESSLSSSSSSSGVDEQFIITCYVVAGCYLIPLLLALFQWIKFLRVHYLPTFVPQKVYACLLFIAAGARVLFFLLSALLPAGYLYFFGYLSRAGAPVFSIMSDAGEMFFFFSFSVLGLFWAGIHYSTSKHREIYERRVRPAFFIIMALFITAEVCCWVLLFLPVFDNTNIEHCHDIGYLVVYLLCTLFTIHYSFRVFRRVYGSPLRSSARTRKLLELIVVTGGCLVFLLFHSASTALYIAKVDLRVIGFTWLSVVGLVCEVIPSLMLLYMLHHVPHQAATQPLNSQQIHYSDIHHDGYIQVRETPYV